MGQGAVPDELQAVECPGAHADWAEPGEDSETQPAQHWL